MGFLDKIFGDLNQKALNKYNPLIEEINGLELKYEKLKDKDIRSEVEKIKEKIDKRLKDEKISGIEDKKERSRAETRILDDFLPEVFALVREASKRTIKQRHFDVQLLGGIVLHKGSISEMKTGEGKTLVATLSVSLNAFLGKGVHVITVNDYLARRDAGWMGMIYDMLGLSCSSIIHEQAFIYDPSFVDEKATDEKLKHLRQVTRQEAYRADITYGTNNEFGFDYLRDNMVADLGQCVQRDLNYAIVDEVDSILIDEARTPLIISAPAQESTDKYRQFSRLVTQLNPEIDYKIDEKMRVATLTEDGIAKMEGILGVKNIYEEKGVETVHHLEQALRAQTLFQKDKDYVVKDGEIIIVDEFTGRLMFGRRYSEGLHQAIEAKEGVEVKQESLTLATISFQNYFRLYGKLAGMTGTAATEAEEFHKIYNLDVLVIPTNKLMIRKDTNDIIYKTLEAKFNAIADDIEEKHKKGQPVLVGTVSIEKNELLSDVLSRRGIPHQVLNAKQHEREAEIIAQAGQVGAVTVATNMAGRGVDIILGGTLPMDASERETKEWQRKHNKVVELGGLHVLGSERHEARRIDNQLRGRSGRQGDPGSSQFFVSTEDDLMRVFGGDRIKSLMDTLRLPDDQPIEHGMITKSIESAQRKVEGHNFDIRKHLVEYDDVMNKHREAIYTKRREILTKESLKDEILGMIEGEIRYIVNLYTADNRSDWQIDTLFNTVKGIVSLSDKIKDEIKKVDNPNAICELLLINVKKIYEEKEKETGSELMRFLEKMVYLKTIDTLWIEHLDAMEHLREGIGLRGYGQRDPLVEYKHEAFNMYQRLLSAIQHDLSGTIFKVTIAKEPVKKKLEQEPIWQGAEEEKEDVGAWQYPEEEISDPSTKPMPGEVERLGINQRSEIRDKESETRDKELVGSGSALGQKIETPITKERSESSVVGGKKKIGRNDPCPCGAVDPNTGKPKKYKKCCGR